MSLSRLQMQRLCQEVQPLIVDAICCDVVAIAPRTFIFVFSRAKAIYGLLLCFQEPFLRFHLHSVPSTSYCNGNPFVQKLLGLLKGSSLLDIALLNDDRILALSLQRGKERIELVAEFLPRRSNCYLLDRDGQILASLSPVGQATYAFPEKPPQNISGITLQQPVHTSWNSAAIAKYYDALQAENEFRLAKQRVVSGLERTCKRAEKYLVAQQRILADCRGWPKIHHEGELLQANLFRMNRGIKEIAVADWDQDGVECLIVLDPKLQPHEQVSKCFRRSRKLRLGEVHALQQVFLAEKEVLRLKELQHEVDGKHSMEGLQEYCGLHGLFWTDHRGRSPLKKTAKKLPYHLYMTQEGMTVWVGKSAKENDSMTFHYAKGSDWWLHAHDYPGSHVILQCAKGKEPDANSVTEAAELALRYSKCKDRGEGAVCISQVKWLKRIKSVPGKVMVSNQKVIHIALDEDRWQRLKEAR